MSYSKGHCMQTVATGPQDGATLVEIFGGVRKKKVFLYFSSVNQIASSSTRTCVAPSSTDATTISTYTLSASSPASLIPSSSASAIFPCTSTTSTITSTTPATRTQRSGGSLLIDLTTSPTGGASTRRYLTALASAAGSSTDISPDEIDDDGINDSIEIVESCGENNVDIQDALVYGHVTHDFMTAGVVSDDHTIRSRTSEVLQCLEVLKDSDGQAAILPFLTHTFEEICWQAYDDKRPIVLLLLNPLNPSQFRATMQSLLQKVQEERKGDVYFWAAESTSKNGKRVVEMYGNGSHDQIVVLVPSTQQTPVFVDRIDGQAIMGFDCARLCARIDTMIQRLSMEREQRSQWTELRRHREVELEQMALTTKQHNIENKDNESSDHEVTFGPVERGCTDDLSATIEDQKEDGSGGKGKKRKHKKEKKEKKKNKKKRKNN